MNEAVISTLQRTSSKHQPWQISCAVVLGCACGMLPKFNLLFPLALAALFVLPIHFPLAIVSSIASSLLAPWIHPIQGQCGNWMFQFNLVASSITYLDQIPGAAWLRLHNSIVFGSMTISAGGAVPALALAHGLFWLYRKELPLERAANRSLLTDEGLSVTVNQGTPHQAMSAGSRAIESTAIDSIHALESLLERAADVHQQQASADIILARAIQASELVDSIVQSLEADSIERLDANHWPKTYQLHDTTISLHGTDERPSHFTHPHREPKRDLSQPMLNTETFIDPAHTELAVSPARPRTQAVVDQSSISMAHETASRNVEIRHEEALRHLLRHLRSIQQEG